MPERQTVERARRDRREGKAPSTQAGEFIREEFHQVREGKHGARSARQLVAIGLSKARQAGVDLPPPKRGTVSEKSRRGAERAYERGQSGRGSQKSSRRSLAAHGALEREGRNAGSSSAASRQGRAAAGRRSAEDRSKAARKGAATKGARGRSEAAREAARTRARHR